MDELGAMICGTMLYFVVFSVVACLVLLYLTGRRNEAHVWRDWESTLTPRGEKSISSPNSDRNRTSPNRRT